MRVFSIWVTLVVFSTYPDKNSASACVCFNRHPQESFCSATFVFSFTIASKEDFYYDGVANKIYTEIEYQRYKEKSLRNGGTFSILERRNKYQLRSLQFYQGKELYESLGLSNNLVSFDATSACGMRLVEGMSYTVMTEGTLGNPQSTFLGESIELHACDLLYIRNNLTENDKQLLDKNLQERYPFYCGKFRETCIIYETSHCWACESAELGESSCLSSQLNQLQYICQQDPNKTCSWFFQSNANERAQTEMDNR